MGMSLEQTALTRRAGFPIPASAELDQAERGLLTKHGHWLEALCNGTLAPTTPEQRHFVLVARGEAVAESAFEIAWSKCQPAANPAPAQGGPLELAGHLAQLIASRAAANAAKAEHATRRAAVLDRVKPELDALDAEFAGRLADTGIEAARTEVEARKGILVYGASFRHSGVHAVYCRGRVSWDAKGLEGYAEVHPDVREFRRVGEPSVSLRFEVPEA